MTSNLSDKSILERTDLIEEALAGALDIEGIAIDYDQGNRDICVTRPGWDDEILRHSLTGIARELERRLFPNG